MAMDAFVLANRLDFPPAQFAVGLMALGLLPLRLLRR